MSAIHRGRVRLSFGDRLLEIVSVRLKLQPARRRRRDVRGNTVAISIGLRFFLRGEFQYDLNLRVARSAPTHERVGPPRFGRGEFQDPLIGERLAGLHGVLRALIDTCGHVRRFRANRAKNQAAS